MIVLGVICLLIGFFAHIPVLWIAGVVLVIVGLVLALIGYRRPAGYAGRRHYY
jgi:hypothetical protein